jgi:hypothetical protein
MIAWWIIPTVITVLAILPTAATAEECDLMAIAVGVYGDLIAAASWLVCFIIKVLT